MNHFQSVTTLSQITISTTNIKSLGVGGKKEEPKLNTILKLNTDVTVVTESRTNKHKVLNMRHKYRTLLSGYEVVTHDSILRGITVFIKKASGCLISNFTEVDSTDTLSFDITCPDMTIISIIAVYAPSADSPSYWNMIYDSIMSKLSDHKLIIGDYNVTID